MRVLALSVLRNSDWSDRFLKYKTNKQKQSTTKRITIEKKIDAEKDFEVYTSNYDNSPTQNELIVRVAVASF